MQKLFGGGKPDVWYATNDEIYNYVSSYRNLLWIEDEKTVINPTNITLYFKYAGRSLHIEPGKAMTMENDKIKKYIDCYIETETCNLKCHYCYIAQQNKFSNKIVEFSHSPEEIRNALSVKRLGGTCLLNMCAGGETLLADILPVIKALLEEGHYIFIVTNGTLQKRFKEICQWDAALLSRLFIKFSFHYLELQRLKLMDVFIQNVQMTADSPCSFSVEVTPNDELIPCISDIKKICKDNFGALPHVSIARDDRTNGIELLSEYSLDEFYDIWKTFDSRLLDYKYDIFKVKRTEFCHAGAWSYSLNLNSGEYSQCYFGKRLGNIYENPDEKLVESPVGTRCKLAHCYNGHAFLTLGNIPGLDRMSYYDMRTRLTESGEEWVKPQMADFMKSRLYETNNPYDISVIIPVYNVKPYLTDCLNSIVKQSKENIEIICIDDCSSDGSPELLEQMALKDHRIQVIKNAENRGRLYARKQGVLAAKGKYIMFLDGDDLYSENACETAYAGIVRTGTDILQFGMHVINKGNAPQFEVDSFCRFITPYEHKLYNSSILTACFAEEKYSYNLVNKIYDAALCKKAFKNLDNEYYSSAEDMLAYFVLAYFAESYMGIPDQLYYYNYAIGVSKPGKLDLESLDRRCSGAESIWAVKYFLDTQGTFKMYQEVYSKIERRILSDNFDAWYYKLPRNMHEEGYRIFEKHWGKDKVILGLLYDIENKQYDIDQKSRYLIEKDQKIEELNNQILLMGEKDSVQEEYEHVLHSLSYRVGCGITWLPRKLAKWFRNIINADFCI